MKWAPSPPQQILRGGILKYWNENRKQYYTHVEPRADWREPVEKWVDWMDVVGRTKQTLRTRYYQLSRFSRVVNKKINDVNEDDIILVLVNICSFQGHCYCRRRPIALFDDYCGSRPPLLRIKATGC